MTEGFYRPLFQRFRHNGMVGIRNSRTGNRKGLVKVQSMLINEQTHELRSTHSRVRIIRVDAYALTEGIPILAKLSHIGTQNRLQAGADKQILLLEAENTPMLSRVIWVQDS